MLKQKRTVGNVLKTKFMYSFLTFLFVSGEHCFPSSHPKASVKCLQLSYLACQTSLGC